VDSTSSGGTLNQVFHFSCSFDDLQFEGNSDLCKTDPKGQVSNLQQTNRTFLQLHAWKIITTLVGVLTECQR
jgi:hypothetical protein